MANIETKNLLFSAINSKNINQLKNIFKHNPIIDLAEIANEFENTQELLIIFDVINNNVSADFFSKLNEKKQEELLTLFGTKEIEIIINNVHLDDFIDIFKNLPIALQKKILKNCAKEKKKIIIEFSNYKENTAASIMTKEYIELPEDITVVQALEDIRKKGNMAATIYSIFLKNNEDKTTGVCGLDKLILAKNNEILKNIKEDNFIYVSSGDDQEKVAKKIQKYNLNVIAVLQDQKLVGIITVDDIIDVIEEEMSEDFALQAGVIPLKDDFYNIPSFKMALNYSPWLIGLIITNIFSSTLLSGYEDKLKNFIFLTAFIPVILDTCGNAGGQTCSVVIRALAVDDTLLKKHFLSFFFKELKTSLLTAFFVSLAAFAVFEAEIYFNLIKSNGINSFRISFIASFSLFIALSLSKILGFIMPIIAKKLNKDPAMMSEPIVTTIADFLGIYCYFKIASFLLSGF